MSFMLMFSVFFFALGAILASFLGVVVGRWGTGESYLTGRSRCDSCAIPLGALELVPIVSWLVLRGRCRHCGSWISPRSTITEAVLGTLFAFAYLRMGVTPSLALFLAALVVLGAIVLYDLRHTLIPGIFSASFVVVSALYAVAAASSMRAFGETFLVAAGLALVLAVLHFGSRGRAMGLADTPVAFGLALLTGPLAFSGFVYAFWIGAIIGIGILMRTPAGKRVGIEVPFAPFLAAGFLLAYVTGWNVLTIVL